MFSPEPPSPYRTCGSFCLLWRLSVYVRRVCMVAVLRLHGCSFLLLCVDGVRSQWVPVLATVLRLHGCYFLLLRTTVARSQSVSVCPIVSTIDPISPTVLLVR